jgi:hypothetical protein
MISSGGLSYQGGRFVQPIPRLPIQPIVQAWPVSPVFHRGSYAWRLLNAAEVIARDIQITAEGPYLAK